MDEVIRVSGLKKYFKEVKAVDDISFQGKRGELFGFLGVNGAGKSTTINMMCTLFKPTAGEIEICGHRVGEEDASIRDKIGVVWQNNCLDERLTVKENLLIRGSLYGKGKKTLQADCEALKKSSVFRISGTGDMRSCPADRREDVRLQRRLSTDRRFYSLTNRRQGLIRQREGRCGTALTRCARNGA